MGRTDITIRDTHIIGMECRERFLPLEHPSAACLKRRDISMAGISDIRGSYQIGRENPGWHVLLYTLKGKGQLLTEDAETVLKSGSLLLLPMLTPHAYQAASATWCILWFHLRPMETWDFLCSSPWSSQPSRFAKPLEAACEGLRHEAANDNNRAAELYAELIAILIEREMEHRHNPREWDVREQMRALWREVDANLQLPWNVELLARSVHFSEGHLHRLTGKYWKMTPMDKVAQLRMTRAKALLAHTDLTVYQIAEQVGYQNPFAFSTSFRRNTGYSPTEYRDR